ncbi:Tyrosine recombinase XerD [Nereida ignava]|uniref:Tyrosine recombinase XerD n=2 Tax=Nereida ignava TaxID=282199 RepID=A0A0U1NPH0_9RHOB|nr:tyrosine-type recombinase/integrase [Nereida ignava]CRK76635.1 Tyrosine recombinase XerD [Nereida ignava]SFJ38820.1 Site-specific recombinase XerD [Nereida ignava DSM 16309]
MRHMSHYEKIQHVINQLNGAYAPNTLRSYYADAKSFVDWCEQRKTKPFPLVSDTVRGFIEHMQLDYSYSTIRRRLSALRRLNGLLGFEDQTFTEDVYLAIRKLKRAKCLEQRQAVGINEDLLVKMIEAQPDTLVGKRNRLLLSLGYDFLARRSELVAIRNEDLTFTQDGALKGIIRRSKTDQYGNGRLVFGSERSAKLLRKWLKLKPKEIQPVFCAINHGRCLDRAICDRQVNEIIKQGLVRVKRYPRPNDLEVSGHSLRVGAAQDLLTKGHDIAAIMRAGGWSEPSTVSRYLRFAEHNIWK